LDERRRKVKKNEKLNQSAPDPLSGIFTNHKRDKGSMRRRKNPRPQTKLYNYCSRKITHLK